MTHSVRRIGWILVFLVLAVPVGGAQGARDGLLQAQSNRALPAGAAIAVEASDIGERAEQVAQVATRSLTEQGFRVAADAPLTLRFHINDAPGTVQRGKDVVVSGRGGSGDRSEVEVDVLVRSKRPETPRPRLSLQFFLFEKGRAPIWTATISAERGSEDPAVRLAHMAETAMRYFGKTKERAFVP